MGYKRVTEEAIKESLITSRGVQSHACRILGITQACMCNRIAKSAKLQEVLRFETERLIDDVEGVLIEKMLSGHMKSIMWFLSTKARHRGYEQSLKAELSRQDLSTEPIRINIL